MAKRANKTLQPAESGVLRENLLKTGLWKAQEASLSAIPCGLRTMMTQLYNVESSYSEPEESLPLDLGLDQIEDYKE